MTFGSKYGRSKASFHVNTKGRTYYKLIDLANQYEPGHTFIIDCAFINNGQYGESAAVGVADVSAPFMVNLPGHLTSQVRDMLQDADAVEAIQVGKAGFRIYEYVPKGSNKVCYSVEWVDVLLPGEPY